MLPEDGRWKVSGNHDDLKKESSMKAYISSMKARYFKEFHGLSPKTWFSCDVQRKL